MMTLKLERSQATRGEAAKRVRGADGWRGTPRGLW